MQHVIIFTCIIVLIIFLKLYQNNNTDITFVTTNSKEYMVLNYKDKYQAAKLLENIRNNMVKLKEHLINKYNSKVKNLNRFNDSTVIIEASPSSADKTYTLNKGEKMYFCLRSEETNEIHELNTLMFVAIHEMAHIMSDSVGHNQEFHENFKFLLKEAVLIGIYKDVDYENNPEMYCGIDINSSPI